VKPLNSLAPEHRFALLILLLGIFLRLAALGTNPPGLFRDEAEKVHTAWSLGLTGGYHHLTQAMGPDGRLMPVFESLGPPLFIDAYGSWTSAVYHWATVPFALVLGPTALAARLPAALVGILTLLIVWRFVRRAFDEEVALLALFFLAISPWHVLFSRWAQQGIFVPLWLALALWIFERGRLAAGRQWWIAGLCLGMALYTYAPMRLTVPLFVLALAFAYRQDLARNRRAALGALLAFVLACLPTALWLMLYAGEGMQRFGRVSIWQEGASLGSVTGQFISNYLRHLSVPFLFLGGDENLRHSVPGFGQMHWIELPGLLLALLLALTQRRPQDLTLALWFLLAPIAPSLTLESPHALRGIAALPAAHILSAAGTAVIFRSLVQFAHAKLAPRRRRLLRLQEWTRVNIDGLRATGLMLGGVTAILFALQLFLRYPALTAESWETGLHEALQEAAPHAQRGTPILVTGHALYLPTHLRVALRQSPREANDLEPYLPPPWNQCGEGPTSPQALWQQLAARGQPVVFVTKPGEIPGHEPPVTIWSPGNRFTPSPHVLWEIHVGGEASDRP
jgi:Dolichyl-phosphate-mannose-protein mannosyltransferase